MSDAREAEIAAYLDRADESIEAAQTLLQTGHPDFAASRAYYAAFYGACAALLNEGLDYAKHSSVISSIHRHFVKAGRLSTISGRNLNWLFELRGIGDYGETRHVPIDQAKEAIDVAALFVGEIKKVLGRN